MKFVVSTAFIPPTHCCEVARGAELSGFDYIAVSDHLVHPETIKTPYPYTPDGSLRWEPFTPWPDPWVTVGAMAALTSTIRFLSAVYVLPMRNPFAAAKAVATAAVLSGGRVSLGIGTGWMREEFDLVGQPFARRGKRCDEMLDVMAKLWSGEMVEHHGEFYDFDKLEMNPAPPQPIPVYAGGASEAVLKRAARLCDGWITDLHSTAEIREMVARLRRYRDDSERAGRPLEVIASANDAFDVAGYRRLEEAGVTHVTTLPWLFYGGDMQSLNDKLEAMSRFHDDVIAKMN